MDAYLITDEKTALAASQKEAQARGCDGIHTIRWFDVRATKDGKFAVVVPQGEDVNLTAQEKATEVDVVTFPDKPQFPVLK